MKSAWFFLFSVVFFTLAARGQTEPRVIHLWDNGAPGFESRRDIPEVARDYWVRNINNPSLTVYLPPPGRACGTAVVIVPGGGHRELVFNAEGRDPGLFLARLGITAFALKYRLAREEGSPYKIENAGQDAYRAMRLVRSRAGEFGIDPHRVGMLGFSAGGEVVAMVAYTSGDGDATAADPIDRLNGRPDFQMLVYPGPLGIPKLVPADAPPAFMLVAEDDKEPSETVYDLLGKYRQAGVSVEAHFLAHGSHAFNMGDRSKLASVKTWPQRMADWLGDSGYLAITSPAQPAAGR